MVWKTLLSCMFRNGEEKKREKNKLLVFPLFGLRRKKKWKEKRIAFTFIPTWIYERVIKLWAYMEILSHDSWEVKHIGRTFLFHSLSLSIFHPKWVDFKPWKWEICFLWLFLPLLSTKRKQFGFFLSFLFFSYLKT